MQEEVAFYTMAPTSRRAPTIRTGEDFKFDAHNEVVKDSYRQRRNEKVDSTSLLKLKALSQRKSTLQRAISDFEMKLIALPDRNKTTKQMQQERHYFDTLSNLRGQLDKVAREQLEALEESKARLEVRRKVEKSMTASALPTLDKKLSPKSPKKKPKRAKTLAPEQ